MSAQDNAKIVQAVVDAYNAKDANRVSTDAADNMELHDIPSGIKHRGPAGHKQYTQDLHQAFPDGKIEVTNLLATDRKSVV